MAIAMYEALGKSMSSYRKNLADIDKGSIKSDLVSYEAAQDRAFTDTLATTVANTVGIIGEKLNVSKEIQRGQKTSGVYESKEEYQPLGKFGKLLGLDESERSVYKSRKTGETLDSQTLQKIGIMDRLGISNKYSDYKADKSPSKPVDLSSTTSASGEMSLDDSIFQSNDMEIDNSLLDNYETSTADISLQERQFGYKAKSERFDINPMKTNINNMNFANVSSPPPTSINKPKQSVFDMIKNIGNIRRRMY